LNLKTLGSYEFTNEAIFYIILQTGIFPCSSSPAGESRTGKNWSNRRLRDEVKIT